MHGLKISNSCEIIVQFLNLSICIQIIEKQHAKISLSHTYSAYVALCVCVPVCLCVCVIVCMCACVCSHVHWYEGQLTFLRVSSLPFTIWF